MRWSEIVGESSVDGVCHTPGTQFHITVGDDTLGALVDLPKEVQLDLTDDDAQWVEDLLHDCLEAAVVQIVSRFNPNAEADWLLASKNDTFQEQTHARVAFKSQLVEDSAGDRLEHAPELPNMPGHISTTGVGATMFAGRSVRIPSNLTTLIRRASVETVDVADVVTVQSYLNKEKLQSLLAVDAVPPVVILDQDGSKILIDGNHRFAAALLRNDHTIQAKIVPAASPKPKNRR